MYIKQDLLGLKEGNPKLEKSNNRSYNKVIYMSNIINYK